MLSQNVEAEDQKNRQQQMIDLSYGGFTSNAPSTSSTQHHHQVKTGFTEKIRADLFNDHTVKDSHEPAMMCSQGSQKENVSSTQKTVAQKQNQIKELQAKMAEMMTKNNELKEKLLAKEGEAKNLRLGKKSVEDQLQKCRNERLKQPIVKAIDPEKEAMRREIAKLKDERSFSKIEVFHGRNTSIMEPIAPQAKLPVSKVPFFSKLSVKPLPKPEMSLTMFGANPTIEPQPETTKETRERESYEDVVRMQLNLAQLHALVASGGHFSDAVIDDTFKEATFMILRIVEYIEYLELDDLSQYIFETNRAFVLAARISKPNFRENLTRFDAVGDALIKDGGKVSVLQPGKLFAEELCAKPRRIIAFYASLAKHSRKFAEKLLTDNIMDGVDEEHHRTFISLLTDTLMSRVSQSRDVYDYQGFVIAVGSLLASLSSHYGNYASNGIIDIALMELFRAVLECRCDNMLLMVHMSQFLADVSKCRNNTGVLRNLCVNYARSNIVEFSLLYRYFDLPPEACRFQLFLHYLLTSFNTRVTFNSREIELLMSTLLNLNQFTSNIQEISLRVFKFLNHQPHGDRDVCECLQMLTNSTVMLNHLLLAHRNVPHVQSFPMRGILKTSIPMKVGKMKFHKRELKFDFCFEI